MEQSKLSPRQWLLKRFLEENFVSGKFYSIKEICDLVVYPSGEKAYIYNTDPYNHDKCVALGNDVRAINWSVSEGYKIIIKDKKGGVKLCENESEFIEWRNNELRPLEKKYAYLNNLKWKAERDGTMPIINQANNPVDTTKDLKSVKVYAEEEKEGETKNARDYTTCDIWGMWR